MSEENQEVQPDEQGGEKVTRIVNVLNPCYTFEKRQYPLEVDDDLNLVVQFYTEADICDGCSRKETPFTQESMNFVERYNFLDSDEKSTSLQVTKQDFFSQFGQLVSCVGCRRSVEAMYKATEEKRLRTLEPVVITPDGTVSLKREVLFDPRSMYVLFNLHKRHPHEILDGIHKGKKHKRCTLHTMENQSQKTRSLADCPYHMFCEATQVSFVDRTIWQEVWKLLSESSKIKITIIRYDALMITVDCYLRKHRFCTECKAKVLRAFHLLRGEELDPNKDKSFSEAAFEGLKQCKEHVHIEFKDADNLNKLLERAEPELNGSRRERHAKTLDVAQEEVLICLGIHLYERLFKVYQKLREDDQTFTILYHMCISALQKKFEMALEKKQGMSKLERWCLEESRSLEQSRSLKVAKKQKKKKKKNNVANPRGQQAISMENADEETEGREQEEGSNQCSEMEVDKEVQHSCVKEEKKKQKLNSNGYKVKGISPCRCDENTNVVVLPGGDCVQHQQCIHCAAKLRDRTNGQNLPGGGVNGWLCKHCSSPASSTSSQGCLPSDCGYSSASEGSCENCSNSGGGGGSAASDLGCQMEGCEMDGDCVQSCLSKDCRCSEHNGDSPCKHFASTNKCDKVPAHWCGHEPAVFGDTGTLSSDCSSLAHMLKAGSCCGEDYSIPEEEVQQFKRNQPVLQDKREKLRKQLKEKFANMSFKPKDRQGNSSNEQC